ncbi:hypothetical protein A1O1_00666 [Capronia coronata CBS 617.96]|uniref:Uncharacterized protein n=1 Tax=Capronia coronata CBS 617.96 TaxID=1182541 RepID=W9ZM26_9EURO|nr:uncharacterized protein A1O1_00666 [Capronia coronata CBS 617.96]EXJ95544.1 hypothetical protein A1O1_00666 [Capronia coronata CBS 617.96]
MSAPIEARSISSLSTLLANPPQYPRNPTHQVHDSLVLYIVRVPGSQDVFLTPLKPPTKTSISIDAVQSSLYFLHVERPEDGELRQSIEATKAAESRNNENIPIQRKPLPPAPHANYPSSQRPDTPPKSYPYHQPPLAGSQTATQADRYAARGSHLRLRTSEPMNQLGIPRKPVGARPLPARPNADPSSSMTDQQSGESQSPLDNEHPKFRLARKPIQSASPTDACQHTRADRRSAYCDGYSPQPPGQESGVPASSPTEAELGASPDTLRITLIRRDPSSGSQWNVGSILYRGAVARDSPLKSFEIELTSPGYVKFAQLEGSSGNGLHRRVAYMLLPNTEGSPATRQRSNSSELFLTGNSASSKRPRQAYSFMSPWQGMCSFSNGLDGKSIRCRHMLPSANPSMAAMPADVAELRFNLPWSILRLKEPNRKDKDISERSPDASTSQPAAASNREHWRRSFQALTHKARVQLSQLEDGNDIQRRLHREDPAASHRLAREDRMDLALGQERAGGGFKGQSAKLGKLIIDDEGLKMCDLVVAASMGVWWQHYAGDTSL